MPDKKTVWLFIFICAMGGLSASDRDTLDLPLTFAQSGEMAVAASIELQTELAQQSLKESAWKMGIRDFFPSVTLSASEDDRVSTIGPDDFSKMYTVSVQQLLFDGGKMSSGRKIEKAQLLLQKDTLQNMLREVSENAIAVYRQVLQGRMTLDIKRQSLAALEKQRLVLDTEMTLGLALETDLLEADIMLEEARIEIVNGELEQAEQEKQFAEMLGLDRVPVLAEQIDITRVFRLPSVKAVQSEILARNPDLVSSQLSILQKEEEAKFASRLWIPTLKGNGSFSLTGDHYPLSHYKWSFGLTIDFSMPWIGSTTSGNYGEEPRTEKNAQLSESLKLLPDPALGLSGKSAKLALNLERNKHAVVMRRLDRNAELLMEKLDFLIRKRDLAIRSKELASAQLRLAETRIKLGHITRLDMMQMELDYAQSEIMGVNTAVDVLSAVREIEKLMALPPGELEHIGGTKQ
ncbi:MAG: TolC family protein [Spirochaetaceae bacterium]|jgi:outer membrane protein TolC|nr:TolC family protein [Spirochaetaceae bacterium]